MINLPATEVMTLRAVRKTAALLMLFLRVSPLAVTVQDVSAIFGIDEKTATKQLQELSMLGKIVRNGYREGYILAEGGKQISLDALFLPEAFPKTTNETGNSPVSGTLVVEDINIVNLIDDSTETGNSPVSSENTFGLKEVLKLTPGLFEGAVVSSSGIEQADPMEALRWIAYAYKNRGILSKPCGLIYSRLRSHTKAPEDVQIECLPKMALRILGLTTSEAEEAGTELEPNPETTQTVSVDATVTPEINQMWAQVLAELKSEMPRASFGSWVEKTQPVHFENNEMVIGVRNTYALDWLANRLSDRIECLLVALAQTAITVKFAVMEVEEI
jgi:hypothetical protein